MKITDLFTTISLRGHVSEKFNPYFIAFSVTFVFLAAYFFRETFIGVFLETIEYKTIDSRFHYRGPITTGDQIVIAAIDEKSLSETGQWPWPRNKIAALVRKVDKAGAKVIAFDVGFFEKEDSRVADTVSTIKKTLEFNTNELKYLDSVIKMSDNDTILADTIKKSTVKVVLGYYFNLDQKKEILNPNDEANIQEDTIYTSQHQSVHYPSSEAETKTDFITAISPESNIDILSDSASYSGFFNMLSDSDNVVRSMPVIIRYNDLLYAPLSLKTISAWADSPISVVVNAMGNVKAISVGDFTVPADRKGRILINYRGPTATFPHVPVSDILNDTPETISLKDKIIIVGATAAGLSDIRATPFGNDFPGCEIHANIIDSIMMNNLLYHPPLYEIWSILAIILCGTLIGIVLQSTGAVTGLVAFVLFTAGYWGVSQFLFSYSGLILNLTYPLFTLTMVYISVTVYKYLTETRKKKFINDAFSTYLAPSVVKQLINSPEKLELGGEDREITAFFSDVQGFTTISEKLNPKELVDLLNEFLTEMTDIILAHEGTVDKFEGDAIIAFFGAPVTLKNHSLITCNACIDMQARLEELNKKWKAENRPELHMRIGLNSGTAVVGNMGSRNRMDYTMMGDVVNTAARLEGVNKIYGTYTMISETTKHMAGPDIVTREIDTIYMVGKHEPVTIHQIIGHRGSIDKKTEATVRHYDEGLRLYNRKQWQEAIDCFQKGLATTPEDGPCIAMTERCREFINTPPEDNWNGVFRITSK